MALPLPLLCLCIAAAHLVGARDANPTKESTAATRDLVGWPPDPGQPSPALEDWEEASEWTSWFNVDHPGGDGDFESLAAIRFYYGPARVCPRPLALEARTTDWALPASMGERVHANPTRGFWCLNREQPRGRRCSNYHVRFRCPVEAAWGAWGAWGLCSKSCGPGRRLRRRSCQSSSGDMCPGSPQEAQKCVRSRCPGCSSDSCGCSDHILLGSVVTQSGQPLPGARVFLRARPGTVATSDTHGTFWVPGVCAASQVNVSAQMDGFSVGTAQAHANSSSSAVVTIVLKELGKPYLVKHPESRVREAGQHVIFCCKASGTPMPKKYSWFHNGTLLDRRQHGSGPHLDLQGLREDQAGDYYCKAWNEAGAVRSRAAQLTVLAPGQPSCDPRPQEHLIKLPDDCGQPGGGPAYLDVGLCTDTRCPGPAGSGPRCGDAGARCCSVLRLESRDIRCSGYVLPVKVVAECGCRKCLPRRGLVRGRVVAADSGEPLRFASILLGRAPIGFTSYQGDFTIEVPPATERLVVTFVDPSGEFVDSVRVLPFDPRGAGVYHEVRALRKAATVLLDAERGGAIPLGGAEEAAAPALGELVLPPGTFRHSDGRPYAGQVEARVTFVDPRDLASARGASSDLRFLDSSGELAPLRTYGMFAVDLRAPGSAEQLHAARATVRVDAEHVRMPGHAEALALWSLEPERLGYQRTDHEDPALKRTGFRVNLARPRAGRESEARGPVYPWRRLRDCEDAPVTDNHFRFSRVEADKYEYDVVPFREGAPASWTGDLLAWWPNPQEFRACFLKVRLQGPQEYMVRSHNAGGTHAATRGRLYGLRDTRSVRHPERPGASAACVEFKCGGMLFDQRQVDRTLVTVTPQGSCRRVAVNTLLQDYLARHPPPAPNDDPTAFAMLAPLDALGHNYGVYTVTDQSPRLAKEIAIGRCFDGSSDGFSREMKADAGVAVTFQCREPSSRPSLFQRLLENPESALGNIRREMGQTPRDSRVAQTQARDSGPLGVHPGQ
uniref:cartilage intermediate layer protein 2 n=1 Tax=Myodes glareolus TaxID=447135 RepID=UPI002020D57D|nr:cartilage intermediate layer protein 2 [Myodes glareolus]